MNVGLGLELAATAQNLPFPDCSEDYRAQIMNALDYPPAGPAGARGG